MAADESPVNLRTEAVAVGIDVGSTTVKAVVVDPVTGDVYGQILRIAPKSCRDRLTGSGRAGRRA